MKSLCGIRPGASSSHVLVFLLLIWDYSCPSPGEPLSNITNSPAFWTGFLRTDMWRGDKSGSHVSSVLCCPVKLRLTSSQPCVTWYTPLRKYNNRQCLFYLWMEKEMNRWCLSSNLKWMIPYWAWCRFSPLQKSQIGCFSLEMAIRICSYRSSTSNRTKQSTSADQSGIWGNASIWSRSGKSDFQRGMFKQNRLDFLFCGCT